MSPRTKRIILAIFLVLLAIPVVYLALTWHPRNPWRIRQVTAQVDSMRGVQVLEIELENTSSVPLHIYAAMLERTAAAGAHGPRGVILAPQGQPLRLTGVGVLGQYPMRAPSHGVLRFEVPVRDAAKDLASDELCVGCVWASNTKHYALMVCGWLEEKLPLRWKPLVPMPTFGKDSVPLKPGLPSS
ncbi:hypothetical protein DES53_115117 [Roseimicrobium gellanilyticum]|uniref:Uncharacterized protein n=1 Tax=Roseimicrobium gellanilyticum TaxID=748857 RepID=A0A366H6T9_9BACT|nr:hypothetical protein [Roseimicrobium gellanilyticum]RBP36976.1 hypothetical protein DES53_115117 [Roseimicrobium gellanilyticum]